MTTKKLAEFISKIIDENHGESVLTLDVRDLSGITDYMIICSVNSDRHLKALADHIAYEVKNKFGLRRIGSSSSSKTDWTLVDFGDVIVHIMLPTARTFYELEKLWQKVPSRKKETHPKKTKPIRRAHKKAAPKAKKNSRRKKT